MKISVIGTGGVGGYFGGRLAQADHEVAFLARGAHLAALRERGLCIESGSGNATVTNAVFTDDMGAMPPCDVAMVCVKLWDVEATARRLAPLLAKGGVAIPFQNGVDAPDILRRELGDDRVLGGIAYIASTIRAPGVIAHTGSMARLVVGAFDPRTAGAAQAFKEACATASVQCDVSPDVRRALWEKFCMLSAMSGCTSMARQPVGVVRSDPDLRTTFEAAVAEAAAAGRARGVALADEYVARQLAFLDGLPAAMRSSMQNDLAAGHRLEAPWLSGAVVRMARESGIAAPVSATLFAAVKPYLDGAP